MIYLSAAVVLVGVLAVLNLVFTVGVIRRLREHTQRLATVSSAGSAPVEAMRAVGEQVDEFATFSTDGVPVSRAALEGETMVGFFTAHCPPCRDIAPEFAERARGMDNGRDRVLAVVVGDGAEAGAFAATLTDAVRVVIEPDSPELGPMVTAFGVSAFPSFCLVNERGFIVATADSPKNLPVPIPA